jgi:hypothetical protein
MDTRNVEDAFRLTQGGQQRTVPVLRFSWSDDDATLTVYPALDRPVSAWSNADRPGDDSDLAVTYTLLASARDKADNSLGEDYTSTYYLPRDVRHWLSPCFELSGSATASGFDPIAARGGMPCVLEPTEPDIQLKAGDVAGEAVSAALSYSLDPVPSDIEFDVASLAFVFGDPEGTPHDLHGPLFLEHVAFGTDTDSAFDAPPLSTIGILASTDARYPLVSSKGVSGPVADALAQRSSSPYVQFRARFTSVDLTQNQAPDYVNLVEPGGDPPMLLVSYRCSDCP